VDCDNTSPKEVADTIVAHLTQTAPPS
jgi:hypothetical protein